MNEWVKKSIDIANGSNYLDRLSEIYPVTLEPKRQLPHGLRQAILDAYENKDELALIRALIKLPKFPIKDSYVAFLRKRSDFMDYNPKTVSRIAQRLLTMSFGEMMASCEEPKEFNRQIGPLFRQWLSKLGYPFLDEVQLQKHRGIAILAGTNGEKMEYANRILDCKLTKGLDLLAKAGKTYVIGEAKFLTDFGGHQNAQFEDALRLVRGSEGNAIRIAILDGVVWIKGNNKMFRTVSNVDGIAMSALLLVDFLKRLK